MRNNILGGLVIFFVVVTCLLILDDISSKQEPQKFSAEVTQEYSKSDTELAVIEAED